MLFNLLSRRFNSVFYLYLEEQTISDVLHLLCLWFTCWFVNSFEKSPKKFNNMCRELRWIDGTRKVAQMLSILTINFNVVCSNTLKKLLKFVHHCIFGWFFPLLLAKESCILFLSLAELQCEIGWLCVPKLFKFCISWQIHSNLFAIELLEKVYLCHSLKVWFVYTIDVKRND